MLWPENTLFDASTIIRDEKWLDELLGRPETVLEPQ